MLPIKMADRIDGLPFFMDNKLPIMAMSAQTIPLYYSIFAT